MEFGPQQITRIVASLISDGANGKNIATTLKSMESENPKLKPITGPLKRMLYDLRIQPEDYASNLTQQQPFSP